MQVDAIDLQTEVGNTDGNDFERDPNHEEGHPQPDVGPTNNTNEEYETWEGFGSGMYPQSMPPTPTHQEQTPPFSRTNR